jgi:hypothetical protein
MHVCKECGHPANLTTVDQKHLHQHSNRNRNRNNIIINNNDNDNYNDTSGRHGKAHAVDTVSHQPHQVSTLRTWQ